METRAEQCGKHCKIKGKDLNVRNVKQGKCFIVYVSKKCFVCKSMGSPHNICNKEEDASLRRHDDGGCRCSVAGKER